MKSSKTQSQKLENKNPRLPIHYSQPTILPEDVKAVERVLNSGWIAGNGPETKRFEDAIAEFTGFKHAIAVCNATAGLFIAASWYLANSTKLKWAFVPTLTFVATANVVNQQGVAIKFADADPLLKTCQTFDMSVSYGGYPLMGNGLIADDAHYLFSDMARVGSYKCRVISMHAVKNIGNSGEGGTILTDDDNFARYAREYRNHGRNEQGLTTFAGLNFRWTDIQAALALSQLQRWEQDNYRRHEIAKYYREQLSGLVELPVHHKRHSYHLFPILFESKEKRDSVQAFLAGAGIGTQIHYRPAHTQPLYQYLNAECPVAEDHYARSLSIPMSSYLNDDEIEYVITSIKQAL